MKKNEKMLRSMELVDEKYVEEADPTKVRRKKKHTGLWALAACFVLMLTGLNLWLYIPFNTDPPDISRYSDSEYYPIIEQFNLLTYEGPVYKNNFEKLRYSHRQIDDSSNGVSVSPSAKDPNAVSQTYREVTDNQVAGVIEGDLIKRSDEYIYYLNPRDGSLRIYSIDGLDTAETDSYFISFDYLFSADQQDWEIFLSEDCTTVTVIAPYTAIVDGDTKRYAARTMIESLDVSDPTNIRRKDLIVIAGRYTTSRMVDGKLLLLNEYYVDKDINFDDESTFLPQIDRGNGFESIPMEDIIMPEKLTDTRYTVVCKLDEQTLTLEDTSAFLSYSDTIYVSNDAVYATRGYRDISEDADGYRTSVAMTEIISLSYSGEQFEKLGNIAVEGWIKDRYSLDEYEGILRVVTTTSLSRTRESSDGEIASVTRDPNSGNSASLYCIDLNTFTVAAKVENFAPKGETVQSVRFDGDSAYVCTAIIVYLTDPVFFFDLSDLDNITYKDTGAIEGFSSSLINIGDGYLLGVGVGGERGSLKLEVYEESENGVVSVCAYEQKDIVYSTDYKTYLVDREHGLFGLCVDNIALMEDPEGYGRYMLFHFDGYELNLLVNEPFNRNIDLTRAVYIDGYLYIFGEDLFKVVKVGMTDGE